MAAHPSDHLVRHQQAHSPLVVLMAAVNKPTKGCQLVRGFLKLGVPQNGWFILELLLYLR